MFGFLRRRQEARKAASARERMMQEITAAHAKIEMLVRAQTRMLDFFDCYDVGQLYDEEYFRLYLYGAFDAATMAYGSIVRSKIGLPLIRVGLTKYLAEELTDGDLTDAENAAANIIEECLGLTDLTTNRAVLEGGTDGFGLLTGQPAQQGGLLSRFGGSHEPTDKKQVEGFVAFMAKDEMRLKALRDR